MNSIIEIISNIIVSIGVIFLGIGIIGIFKYKDFYSRQIVAAKIDTISVLFIIFGIALRYGFSFFTLKLLMIAIMIFILNPFVGYVILRSATQDNTMKHPNGIENEDVEQDDSEKKSNSIDGPWVE